METLVQLLQSVSTRDKIEVGAVGVSALIAAGWFAIRQWRANGGKLTGAFANFPIFGGIYGLADIVARDAEIKVSHLPLQVDLTLFGIALFILIRRAIARDNAN